VISDLRQRRAVHQQLGHRMVQFDAVEHARAHTADGGGPRRVVGLNHLVAALPPPPPPSAEPLRSPEACFHLRLSEHKAPPLAEHSHAHTHPPVSTPQGHAAEQQT
jgi:hypothetical protein